MRARIGGLILAAGGSTRLGRPKQLIELHGEPLVHVAVRAARDGGCDPVCAVTGQQSEAVERAVADLTPTVAHHESWQRGMGSSIRFGLETLGSASAVVILACDQPFVNAEVIAALIRIHRETNKPIVASAYAQTLGIPALFARSCFPELLTIADTRGAKLVIQSDPNRVAILDFPAGKVDLDTPDDLRKWREGIERRSVSRSDRDLALPIPGATNQVLGSTLR